MSFTNLNNTTVKIQMKTNIGTDYQPDWEWSTFATLDCTIDLISERSQPRSEGYESLADHVFFTDYFPGVTNLMRCFDGVDYYNIYSVHNPNRMNRHLEIKALKDQPGAS